MTFPGHRTEDCVFIIEDGFQINLEFATMFCKKDATLLHALHSYLNAKFHLSIDKAEEKSKIVRFESIFFGLDCALCENIESPFSFCKQLQMSRFCDEGLIVAVVGKLRNFFWLVKTLPQKLIW